MDTTTLRPRPTWATTDGHIELHGPSPRRGTTALGTIHAVETVYRFALAFGERDRDVLADCFTQDATFEANIGGETPTGLFTGRDGIVEWLTSYWPRQTDQRRHLVTSPQITELSPIRVVVTAMLLLAASEAGGMRVITAGFYRCELVREADRAWRIATFRAGYDAPY